MKKHYPRPEPKLFKVVIQVAMIATWDDPDGPQLDMLIVHEDNTVAIASFTYSDEMTGEDALTGTAHPVWKPTNVERELMMQMAHIEMQRLKGAEEDPTVN